MIVIAVGAVNVLVRVVQIGGGLLDLVGRGLAHLDHLDLVAQRHAGERVVGVDDDHVEALIDINRSVSAQLTAGRDLSSIQRRAVLAWQESGWVQSLERWLLGEIQRKARLH